jgi:hypothetical protein
VPTPRPPANSSRSNPPPSRRSDWESVSIPTRQWRYVRERVDRLWIPELAPHHSLFGQNGSGKTHLIVNGLLPMCLFDNVAIFDTKGDDPTLSAAGAKPVRGLPNKFRRSMDDNKEKSKWFRIVAYDDVNKARDQFGQALERIYKEGSWIVVLDETRAISDPRSPGLGLQPELDRIWLRGRSRRICVIAATQAPRWVPTSFYDQCQFAWSSRIRDDRAHQRIMEIGSMTRAHIPHIASIRKRRWLYMDDEEEDTWLAETGL